MKHNIEFRKTVIFIKIMIIKIMNNPVELPDHSFKKSLRSEFTIYIANFFFEILPDLQALVLNVLGFHIQNLFSFGDEK